MAVDHFSYSVARHSSAVSEISDEEKSVIECIDWMLKNIRSQFDGLKYYSMLTPILPDHRVIMMVVERTLHQLREALMEKNFQRAHALFFHIIDLTSVPDQQTIDPRIGVNQILNWHKQFANLRIMRSDEDRLL